MVHGYGLHRQPAGLEFPAGLERLIDKHRIFAAGDPGEIRPDEVIHQVLFNSGDDLREGVDIHRLFDLPDDVVRQKEDAFHVIEVRMADQDIVDLCLRPNAEGRGDRAGVHHQNVVHQEPRRVVANGFRTGTPEYFDFHRLSLAQHVLFRNSKFYPGQAQISRKVKHEKKRSIHELMRFCTNEKPQRYLLGINPGA